MTDNSQVTSSMSLIKQIKIDGTAFEAMATQRLLPAGDMSISLHPGIIPSEKSGEAVAPAQPSPAAPSQPSTQPRRSCFFCNAPTKKRVHLICNHSGPEDEHGHMVTKRISLDIYFCKQHAGAYQGMSFQDLEQLKAHQEEVQAQEGAGVNAALEALPEVPLDSGKVDTATAALIEQSLLREAASYESLPNPNPVFASLLQAKVDSFRNALKDAKEAETSATAPGEVAAEEIKPMGVKNGSQTDRI